MLVLGKKSAFYTHHGKDMDQDANLGRNFDKERDFAWKRDIDELLKAYLEINE